jgi:hypothetical protein
MSRGKRKGGSCGARREHGTPSFTAGTHHAKNKKVRKSPRGIEGASAALLAVTGV